MNQRGSQTKGQSNIQLFCLVLAVSGAVASSSASETNSIETNAIRFGVARSTLIVTGKFRETFSGGFGATSRVEVESVQKSPEGFQSPASIEVYWTTLKENKTQLVYNTNLFLFFLRAANTNKDTGYIDVTYTNSLVSG